MDPTPGNNTSEYRLARLAFVIGTVADGFAVILHSLQLNNISAPWFGGAILGLGIILQIVSVLGYTKARTDLKLAAIQAKKELATANIVSVSDAARVLSNASKK